ncbi:MAG: FAD-binding protein [Planctomycetes bacterium]|nr:FAD-binding protein [Planctomycetota bacterium]
MRDPDARIARELRRVLPRERVLTDRGELALYASDGLTVHRGEPAGVALVATRAEAVEVVRVFARSRRPFVARGAGTGLSGGAVPARGAWVVDVNLLRRILEVNALDRYAVVEPGVVNLDVDRAVAPHGLRYAPDPSSQRACTIGGNIAENAGGPHCFLHGMTTRHVLGLTVVLPDGEVARFGGPPGTPAGDDWRGLFVGAEGTLGLTIEATLALIPRPERVHTCLASFPSLGGACRAVARIIAAGVRPAALEILDRLTIRAVEASVFRAGYPERAEAVLLIEEEGSPQEIAAELPAIRAACAAERMLAFEEAANEDERQRLWRGRKGAFGAMGRLNTDLYVLDGVVPRRRMAEVIERIVEIGRRHGVSLANVFHAGDGNLHPNLSFDGRDPEETRRVLAAGAEILRACVDAGGTLSGEHGIGFEKREYMPWVFDEDDLATQRAVRAAIDPHEISNPEKIFPSGRGCVEAGRRDARHAARAERVIGE